MGRKGGVSMGEVQEYLGGIDYPADKNKLVNHAKQRGAPQEVVSLLNKIPDSDYGTPIDVSKALGKIE